MIINKYIYIYIHINIQKYIEIYTNTYKHIKIYRNVQTYIQIHTNTYKHIQIYKNIYKHIQTLKNSKLKFQIHGVGGPDSRPPTIKYVLFNCYIYFFFVMVYLNCLYSIQVKFQLKFIPINEISIPPTVVFYCIDKLYRKSWKL